MRLEICGNNTDNNVCSQSKVLNVSYREINCKEIQLIYAAETYNLKITI